MFSRTAFLCVYNTVDVVALVRLVVESTLEVMASVDMKGWQWASVSNVVSMFRRERIHYSFEY